MFRSIKPKNFSALSCQGANQNLQIFDLLQLSRKEQDCRSLCRRFIRDLESWRRKSGKTTKNSFKFYEDIEGLLLRRRAQDAVMMYRLLRRERVRLFADYMGNLPARSSALPFSG